MEAYLKIEVFGLVISNLSHWHACLQETLAWDGIAGTQYLFPVMGMVGSNSQAAFFCNDCLHWEKNVDYLPMAKPVAINS